MSELDPQLLLLGAVIVVAFHFGLLLLSLRFNPLYLVISAFLIVSPLSAAIELPGVSALKYIRLYITLLTIAIAVLMRSPLRIGPAARFALLAMGFYTLAGLWSDNPASALIYKSMMLLTLFCGFLLTTSCRNRIDFRQGFRILLIGVGVFTLVALVGFLSDPSNINRVGRLALFGMNPNRVGQTAAPMFILCMYLALHDPARIIKMISYGTATVLGLIILYTGSRGAAGEALIGTTACLIPLVRHPIRLIVAMFCLGAVGFLFVNLASGIESTERMMEINFDNRAVIWAHARSIISEYPLFGAGWVHDDLSGGTANMHNMYLQLLVESGFLGITTYACFVLFMIRRFIKAHGAIRMYGSEPLLFFAIGVFVAIHAHGIVEAGTLMGSTINCLMLGLATGLADSTPAIAYRETINNQPTATSLPPSSTTMASLGAITS